MKLTELLDTIQKETTQTPQWADGNYLSELLLRLASYHATLGDSLATAEESMGHAEVHYKFVHESEKTAFIEGGDTAALAESKAYQRAKLDRDEYVRLKYKYRLLQLARGSLETTIDAIRSRLSYMKTERDNV